MFIYYNVSNNRLLLLEPKNELMGRFQIVHYYMVVRPVFISSFLVLKTLASTTEASYSLFLCVSLFLSIFLYHVFGYYFSRVIQHCGCSVYIWFDLNFIFISLLLPLTFARSAFFQFESNFPMKKADTFLLHAHAFSILFARNEFLHWSVRAF